MSFPNLPSLKGVSIYTYYLAFCFTVIHGCLCVSVQKNGWKIKTWSHRSIRVNTQHASLSKLTWQLTNSDIDDPLHCLPPQLPSPWPPLPPNPSTHAHSSHSSGSSALQHGQFTCRGMFSAYSCMVWWLQHGPLSTDLPLLWCCSQNMI